MGYVGVAVPRREDDRLLRGTRVSVADLALPGVLELAFVRSEQAHGRVRSVDAAPARAVAGVVGAWSAADLPGLPDVPTEGENTEPFGWPALARDRVRFVGQTVAAVVAADRYAAEDGCEAVVVDVEPLPPLVDPRAALEPHAPLLFEEAGTNQVSDSDIGEPVEDLLAAAPVVVEARYREQLIAPTSMEGRAVAVRPDDDGGLTVWVSHQAPHRLRTGLAGAFGLEERLVRVVVPDAGGAFGAKSQTYPEYLVVAHLARLLRRPVRWSEDRHEALAGATHGRGQYQRVRLAADTDGRLLALDLEIVADVGGYPHAGDMVPKMTALVATGGYRLDRAHVRVRTAVTTTAPTSSYRGAGRPEAAYALERTVDALARRLGVDPAELRRRNFLAPDDFPHETPTGACYDSGNYARALDVALDVVDYPGVRAEQARRRAAGDPVRLGVGLCCYVERSGAQAHSPEYGAVEARTDGSVVAWSGSSSTGQGHETVFPQIVAHALEIDVEAVRLIEADTREVPQGLGSFGSRSAQVGGGALVRASTGLVRRAREKAAELSGVPLERTRYGGGIVEADTPDGPVRSSLGELAGQAGPLRADDVYTPPQAFPFGCYAAVVEIDGDTGLVTVRTLVAVDDYGVVINPMVVQGQGLGSVVQGLGQALYESASYDEQGRPEQLTLLDYLIPTVAELPGELRLEETETPNPNHPLGVKGAGEAGCIGTPPAVLNAIADALDLDDPTRVQLPATPDRVWALMQG